MIYVTLYLMAIILANLSSTYFGPTASIVNALVFIGLDLTTRDKLHDVWMGRGLVWKMGILILVGSFMSWFINRDAGMIAIASFSAFAVASIVDAVVYQFLHKRNYLIRVNGSNIISAAVDSLVFPTIAFGGFLFWISFGQFIAKVLGGAVWSLILRKKDK